MSEKRRQHFSAANHLMKDDDSGASNHMCSNSDYLNGNVKSRASDVIVTIKATIKVDGICGIVLISWSDLNL